MGRIKMSSIEEINQINFLPNQILSRREISTRMNRSAKVINHFVKNKENYGKNYKGRTKFATTPKERRMIIRAASNSTNSRSPFLKVYAAKKKSTSQKVDQKNTLKQNIILLNNNVSPQSNNVQNNNTSPTSGSGSNILQKNLTNEIIVLQNNIILQSNTGKERPKEDYLIPRFNAVDGNALFQNNYTINTPVHLNPIIVNNNNIIRNPIVASPNGKSNIILYVPIELNSCYQGKLLQCKSNVKNTPPAGTQLLTELSTVETKEQMNTALTANKFISHPTSDNMMSSGEEEDSTIREINEILSDLMAENTVKQYSDTKNNPMEHYPNTHVFLNPAKEFNNLPKETPTIADNNGALGNVPEENLDCNQNIAQENHNIEYNCITDNEKNNSVVNNINNFDKALDSHILKGFDLDLDMPTPLMEEILFDNDYSILSDAITNDIYNTQLENNNTFTKHDVIQKNNVNEEISELTSILKEIGNVETFTSLQENELIRNQTQDYRTVSEFDIDRKQTERSQPRNEMVNLSVINEENEVGPIEEEEINKIKVNTGKLNKALCPITEECATELLFNVIDGDHSNGSINIKETNNFTDLITFSNENHLSPKNGSNESVFEFHDMIELFPITEVNHTPFNNATDNGFVELNPIESYDQIPKNKQITDNNEMLNLNISELNKIADTNRSEDVNNIIVYDSIPHDIELNHILPTVNTKTSENEIAGLNPVIEYNNENPTHFIENIDYNEANDGEKQMNFPTLNLSGDLQFLLNQYNDFERTRKSKEVREYKKYKANKLKKHSSSISKLKKSSRKLQKSKLNSNDAKSKNGKKSKHKSKKKSKKSLKRKHTGKDSDKPNETQNRKLTVNDEHNVEKLSGESHNEKITADNKDLTNDNGVRIEGNSEETSPKKKKRSKKEKIEQAVKDLDDDKGEVRRPFRCHICTARFTRHYNLNEHLTRHTDEKVTCTICKEPFSCLRYLSRHVKKHGMKCPYKCDECDQEYDTYKQYSQHKKFHKRTFVCHCGLIFNSKPLQLEHERSHLGKNSFRCRVCAKNFVDETEHRQHELLCSTVKSYCQVCDAYTHQIDKCPVCDTPFSVKNMLDKPFKCTLCERQYMSKVRLTRHKLDAHKGMMRFKCKYCGFRSSDRGNFVAHKRLHTDDRPFACSYCPKRFTYGPTLTKHLRLHTGVGLFPCRFCQKRFKLEIDLQKHEELHVKTIESPNRQNMNGGVSNIEI